MKAIHNPDQGPASGFWGPVTSTVDWCELNYVRTPYLAEFFNTLSNLPMVLLALLHFYHTRRNHLGRRFEVSSLVFAGVALGSAAFHGTLRYEAQMGDELPMLALGACLLYCFIESGPTKKLSWLPGFLVVVTALYSLGYMYLFTDYWDVFGAAFGILILVGNFDHFQFFSDPVMRKGVLYADGLFIAAYVAWTVDQTYCPETEPWYLHAAWHVLSAFAGSAIITLKQYVRWRHHLGCTSTTLRWRAGIVPMVEVDKAEVGRWQRRWRMERVVKDERWRGRLRSNSESHTGNQR